MPAQEKLEVAITIHRRGELAKAQRLYEQILRKKPHDVNALNLLGVVLLQRKKWKYAIVVLEKALQIDTKNASCFYNYGFALCEERRLEEAVRSYDNAIILKHDYVEALYNRGIALFLLDRFVEAVDSYDRAVAFEPRHAKAYSNRGVALSSLNRLPEAVASQDTAIALEPNYQEAHFNRGLALAKLNRLVEAVASFDKASSLGPVRVEIFLCRGKVLNELERIEEAISSYDHVLALKPDCAEAYANKGMALFKLKRFSDALASYDEAITLKPDYAEAYLNHGICLHNIHRLDEAVVSYKKAIGLKSDYSEAYYNLGIAFADMGKLDEAKDCYRRALALRPNEFIFGNYLYAKMCLCDWLEYDRDMEKLSRDISSFRKAAAPFVVLAAVDDPFLHKCASEVFAGENGELDAFSEIEFNYRENRKIHVGYYSADFRDHAMAYLLAELFEKHDRAKFEITAFSFGVGQKDGMRRRFESAFDRFIDISEVGDREVVELSRRLGIDIAVDLMGYTRGNRAQIFSKRSARIQVNYMGYPGTLGQSAMDYIIADKTVIPDSTRKYFTEKVIFLPNSYQVNTHRPISQTIISRSQEGLGRFGFVFCCFCNSYKIQPCTFDSWMRILTRVDGSGLWLLEDSSSARSNLRREAATRGVNGDRVIFANRVPFGDYLARYRCVDLFLDTFPYNAHTTASDALWAGLPVLTRMGKSFASRVAGSVLKSGGLDELICHSEREYEEKAVELAMSFERLQVIRSKVVQSRLSSSLFDSSLSTKHIETAYRAIYLRSQAGLAPDHIEVLG